MDGYTSKQLAYQWVLIVSLCLPICFNFIYRYLDGVLSLKKLIVCWYLEFIYLLELEIKEITEAATFPSYLDCYLYIDNGKLATPLFNKRDIFNFPIVNFPFLSSNIPAAPAYGVYVSQLIRNARACSKYQDFIERGKVLTTVFLILPSIAFICQEVF